MTKVCICCEKELSIDDFYKHSGMADGRVNKCKNCCKAQSNEREKQLRKDPKWLEQERQRNRTRTKDYINPNLTPEKKKLYIKNYKNKYPEKVLAKDSIGTKRKKGFHYHHWSYNKEHWKDIIELTHHDHFKAHRFLIYDQERMMYRRSDTNELLDTKEKHNDFITHCIVTKPE